MKKFLFLFLLLSVLVVVQAQKVYFIYLQSDNNTPFYVKMNDKVYSSSALGYLILPKLKDSTYTFYIGRPAAQEAELRFSVVINGGDKGFLLKQFENGYSLFDLQTMAVQKPVSTNTGNNIATTKKSDPFTKMLSQAANDTSILNVPVAVKEEKKPETADAAPVKKQTIEEQKPVQKDTVAITKTDIEVKPENKPQPETTNTTTETTSVSPPPTSTTPQAVSASATVNNQEQVQTLPQTTPAEQLNYKRSVVTRRSESSTTEGFGLVFLDNHDGVVDTIRLLIPNSKIAMQQNVETIKEEPATTNSNTAVKENTGCNAMATENDFLRLRKDMAAKSGENNMIDEARKIFRRKCFTTEQIRNLSTLFLTAEGKYNFFDAAYRHTFDLAQFPGLETELKNENYIRRFRALVSQ